MPREAVRPRRRHLAALLEMPGRPDPQRLSQQAADRQAQATTRGVGVASHRTPDRRTRSRAGRGSRASRRVTSAALRPALRHVALGETRGPRRASTSSTVMSSRHQRRAVHRRLMVARARAEARDGHVERRPRAVASRIGRAINADDRRARAAARCSGPVSPETTSEAAPSSVSSSPSDVAGAMPSRRQPRPARRPRASGSSPGPQATTDGHPWPSADGAASCAETLRRPALVRPAPRPG